MYFSKSMKFGKTVEGQNQWYKSENNSSIWGIIYMVRKLHNLYYIFL